MHRTLRKELTGVQNCSKMLKESRSMMAQDLDLKRVGMGPVEDGGVELEEGERVEFNGNEAEDEVKVTSSWLK